MIEAYSKEILEYINRNSDSDAVALMLKKSPFDDIDMREIAMQIKGRKVARQKFPFLLDYPQFRYPVSVSIEQSSSELTSIYKASLMSGELGLDLTGGMGIDTFIMSQQIKHIDYVESDERLCALARYNAEVLSANVEVHNTTAENFLDKVDKLYDWLYIDPARRANGNRQYQMEDLIPNVVEMQHKMLNNAQNVLIKLSPMQDVAEVLQKLRNVNALHFVSVKGELKEILVHISKDTKELVYTCALLGKQEDQMIHIDPSAISKIHYSQPSEFLYLPDVTLLKSQKQDVVSHKYYLSKVHPNTHIYTSSEIADKYPGRCYRIIKKMNLKKKSILDNIDGKHVNVISKNYPLSATDVKRKIGIRDGGNSYLLCFTSLDDKRYVLLCQKVY